MLALLFALTSGCCDVPPVVAALPFRDCTAHAEATRQDPDVRPLKALNEWLKRYQRGKIDYRSKADIGKESLAVKYDVRPKAGLGNPTWAGDLQAILASLAERGDAEAVRAMTEVAAIGLDDAEYTYAMAPYDVRAAALEAIAKVSSDAAKKELARGAQGDWKADRKQAGPLRAAALLGLGYVGDAEYRPVIEAALADGDDLVRINAIEALSRLGDDKSALALIGVLERETSDVVLVAAAKALRNIYGKYLREADAPAAISADKNEEKDKDANRQLPPASTRLAVRAAIKALGRTSWRADTVLVRLLDDFRSEEAVPALIAVLERFRDNPDDVKSGKSSGLLLHQAHELLVSMTGAVFPATEPDKWRELWEREKDRIKVADKKVPAGSAKTSSAGFAGIPVEGTRVVFVLDLSGSMEWPMEEQGTDGKNRRLARIDYAKRELHRAIDDIAPNAMFNLVTFNGDDKAERWSKQLVVANKHNRERFKKYVDKLRPLGGTNLWSGIEDALDIKSLVYGNHYETSVDEVFILSDGAPTVGEVIDPIEILRLVEEVNRFNNVRINTVFISSATPPEMRGAQPLMSITPQELMRRLARANGGKFREV